MPTSLQITDKHAFRNGFIATAGAFVIWGLFPLYLKPLATVPAIVIGMMRGLMACALTLAWLGLRGELPLLWAALREPQVRWRLLLTSLLVNLNWVLYAWGVANGHVIDTSLGYFINPLFNVLLGVVALSERLNRMQFAAVTLAALGVGYLTWMAGQVPWLALTLAFTFSLYGLIRKITPVAPLPGLAAEMLMFAPAAACILFYAQTQPAWFFERTLGIDILLALSGAMTAVPLVLFAFGAQRIPYATVGMLQYIGPSLQLMLGIVLFHEPFAGQRVVGFCLIWLALLIYAADGLWRVHVNRS